MVGLGSRKLDIVLYLTGLSKICDLFSPPRFDISRLLASFIFSSLHEKFLEI